MFDIFTREGFLETLYFIPALLISLAIHEFGHSIVAYKLGDKSQKAMGRLTLSPFAHVDPLGFIFILLFKFGWGKPVMIDDRNFKNRAKGNMLVALAGPVFNIILAIVLTIVLKVLMECGIDAASITSSVGQILYSMLVLAIQFNIVFAVFNLLPLPPFDGSKVLYYFLPYKAKRWMDSIERYSIWILIVLLYTGLYSYIILPAYMLVTLVINFILNI